MWFHHTLCGLDYHLEDEEMGAGHSLDIKHTIMKHDDCWRKMDRSGSRYTEENEVPPPHSPENELVLPEGIG